MGRREAAAGALAFILLMLLFSLRLGWLPSFGYGEGRWCTMKVDFATVAQAVIAARREWVEAHSSGRSETGVRDPATVPSTADTLAGLDQALSARTRGDGAAQERATRQARP